MTSSPSSSDIPLANSWHFLHGRINPGLDESIHQLQSVPQLPVQVPVAATETRINTTTTTTEPQGQTSLPPPRESPKVTRTMETTRLSIASHHDPAATSSTTPTPTRKFHLTTLPTELMDLIFSFLGPIDLVRTSSTCRLFALHAKSDLAWQHHVQGNIPGLPLASPAPARSYRDLYRDHDPHWFLTRYKLWFADYYLTGKIILIRFEPEHGRIRGYRLLAERSAPTFDPWEADDEVIIHSFDPNPKLHLDQPVLQLEPRPPATLGMTPSHPFNAERPMPIATPNHNAVFANFMLTRAVEARPGMQLWPPPTIPSTHRVRNASHDGFAGTGHKPQHRAEVNPEAFRIRRWMEMSLGPNVQGHHLGEEVDTYATLDPRLYTPTPEKPYRGIWVGDYSGHGCEFLLVHQPDDMEPFDESKVVQRADETKAEWDERKMEERIYRGRIEAIKLTGDPNIPRGEYTFIADDIGPRGFVRKVEEPRFRGARIVKSRGHVAARMFRNDKFIESQLIMISPHRLAQYWVGFGHISFYERVEIDQFLNPLNDPPPKPSATTTSS